MESLAIKSFSLTQVELYEYSLVAYPDPFVDAKVLAEKECFANTYHHNAKSTDRPALTIASFLAREAMEDTIIRYTQRVCSQQPSFNVELNNYSGHPPHTIYLRVQNPEPFKQLAYKLKVVDQYVSSCSCPSVKLITNPRLAIAKKIPESTFLEALLQYSQKTFHESFLVSELVLVRKATTQEAAKRIQVFHLQPTGYKPFETTLFN